MNTKRSVVKEFTKGIVRENPVLVLILGTCPTLAVTTAAPNALGMGVTTAIVLTCSNIIVSLLRKVIPDKVRIPAFVTIAAGLVSVLQILLKAYLPSVDQSLGIFLPLIVVNCIILGRAEMFANKNTVLVSAADGLGMGVGFMAALLLMGSIREILGSGTWFGLPVLPEYIDPALIFMLPPGGFFVFGLLVALSNKLSGKDRRPKGIGCAACPMVEGCTKLIEKEGGKQE